MKSLSSLALVLITTIAMAKESKRPEALNVDSACAADAQTAGCGQEKVGTGMLKCIAAYHKNHKKEFKISEACNSARRQLEATHETPTSMKK